MHGVWASFHGLDAETRLEREPADSHEEWAGGDAMNQHGRDLMVWAIESGSGSQDLRDLTQRLLDEGTPSEVLFDDLARSAVWSLRIRMSSCSTSWISSWLGVRRVLG